MASTNQHHTTSRNPVTETPAAAVQSPWVEAANLAIEYARKPGKCDDMLARLPDSLRPEERRRCQFLFLGLIRHLRLVDHLLGLHIRRAPRSRLRAFLQLGAFELVEAVRLDEPQKQPKIVDHAVGQTKRHLSTREASLVNAVLRKLPADIARIHDQATGKGAEARALSLWYSHPLWLVERWLRFFGADATTALLKWNQQPASVYVRKREGLGEPIVPPSLKETRWEGFYEYAGGHWQEVETLLQTGQVYAQDPSTRIPPLLLNVQPGEIVLDACAAPGGKSLQLAEALNHGEGGLLVAMDQPGPRHWHLQQNLASLIRQNRFSFRIAEVDLRQLVATWMRDQNLPTAFSAVLLDAPCSNTGVLRRRPDAKWRLQPDDIADSASLQTELLQRVAALVEPGGRLVYSTCSVEPEENRRLVEGFLKEHPDFQLRKAVLSYPWDARHDGGGAFLLGRNQA